MTDDKTNKCPVPIMPVHTVIWGGACWPSRPEPVLINSESLPRVTRVYRTVKLPCMHDILEQLGQPVRVFSETNKPVYGIVVDFIWNESDMQQSSYEVCLYTVQCCNVDIRLISLGDHSIQTSHKAKVWLRNIHREEVPWVDACMNLAAQRAEKWLKRIKAVATSTTRRSEQLEYIRLPRFIDTFDHDRYIKHRR